MIGTKKLSTIKKEIEQALASAGADPIQRLDGQIASAKRKGERTEVLDDLKKFLESPRPNRKRDDVPGKKMNAGDQQTDLP